MSDLGRSLHLTDAQWANIRADQLLSKTLIVVIAYMMLAFNRFGFLSFTDPRSSVRLVLFGVYSWLAMATLFWLIRQALQQPMTQQPMTQQPVTQQPMTQQPMTLPMALVAVGSTHAPLLGTSIFVAIVAGFAQLQGPGWVATIVLVGIWMPALVVQAARAITGFGWKRAAIVGLGAHVIWLATMGRHLLTQIGHLL